MEPGWRWNSRSAARGAVDEARVFGGCHAARDEMDDWDGGRAED